ncbi:unnamed protein product, partial [Closterium sp. NIES-65]
VVDLPFALFSTFVIEQRHGFNKQTLLGFIKDRILGILLMVVILPPVLAACIRIVQVGGNLVAVYLWLFMLAFSLFMLTIYPVAIAPLFNKFTPLEAGTLRSKIEGLAGSLSYPLKKIFVMDGSQRSAHSNAYLYGFFKNKRIVLYDTLLSHCKEDEEEVVAVIAHELGHWKLGHTIRFFLLSQALMLIQCSGFIFVRSQPDIFRSFGFKEEPVIIAILLFQHLSTPVSHLLDFGLNIISRTFEYQADAFAVKMGYAPKLRSGLIKMQEENLSAMNTDPWYSAYHHSHPCLPERLSTIDAEAKRVGKKEDSPCGCASSCACYGITLSLHLSVQLTTTPITYPPSPHLPAPTLWHCPHNNSPHPFSCLTPCSHPSHFSSCWSCRGHVSLWEGQCTFWHSLLKYATLPHPEQFLNFTPPPSTILHPAAPHTQTPQATGSEPSVTTALQARPCMSGTAAARMLFAAGLGETAGVAAGLGGMAGMAAGLGEAEDQEDKAAAGMERAAQEAGQ